MDLAGIIWLLGAVLLFLFLWRVGVGMLRSMTTPLPPPPPAPGLNLIPNAGLPFPQPQHLGFLPYAPQPQPGADLSAILNVIGLPLPEYNGDPGTFTSVSNMLENQCFARGIGYVMEHDPGQRLAASAHLSPADQLKNQRAFWSLLHHAFHKEMPSFVNYPDRSRLEFATEMWFSICGKIRPNDTISARDFIAQLNEAIQSFKGEMEEYIKRIRRIQDKLAQLGHPQSELLTVSNIHTAVLHYASRSNDPLQANWGNFMATLQINSPGGLTLDLLEKHGTIYQIGRAHV